MPLRFTFCCAGALLLHAGLLALGSGKRTALPPVVPSVFESRETEVELLAPAAMPEEPTTSSPPREPPPAASAAPTDRPRFVARAPRLRAATSREASATAPPAGDGASSPPVAGVPEATQERHDGKRLSLADLGVSPGGGAFHLQLPDAAPKPPNDPGQLRDALMSRDTELGLGPGGAVASAVRASAYELAPLGSQATFSVDLAPDGSISAVSLVDASSNGTAWNALLRALREDLARLSVKIDRPLRITLRLTNRSTKRAGNSGGPLTFDLSNIGSPTIQSLHVRVLAQTPLAGQ